MARPLGPEILDSIDLPIVAVDGGCLVADFNRAAAALLSLGLEDIGRPLGDIGRLAELRHIEEACEHVIRGGNSSQWEMSDGAGSWFSIRVGPYRLSGGEVVGAVL